MCQTKPNNTRADYDQERKEKTGKPKHSQSTFEAAATVCGRSSIGRFYRRNRSGTLLPCLPSPSCFRQKANAGGENNKVFRTNGYYLGSSIESGNLVWPTCGSSVMRRDISKNAQNTTLDTVSNPNPNPTPININFVRNKSGIFSFWGNKWSTKLRVVS